MPSRASNLFAAIVLVGTGLGAAGGCNASMVGDQDAADAQDGSPTGVDTGQDVWWSTIRDATPDVPDTWWGGIDAIVEAGADVPEAAVDAASGEGGGG